MSVEPDETSVERINTRAVVGLGVSVVVGVAGLFLLPAIQSTFGLTFGPAFAIVLGLEFVAVGGVTFSLLRLHEPASFD